jgi:hypothetical protein
MGIDRQPRAALEERTSVVTPESDADEHGQWRNQMSVESEMKTFVREKFGNHESEMKQLSRQLREKVDSWRNWRSERGWGSQKPNTAQSTTKTCWQCRTEINSQARVCPHCRGKQPSANKGFGLFLLGVCGVMLVIGGATSNGTSTSTTTSQTTSDYRPDYNSSTTPVRKDAALHNKGVAAMAFYSNECSMTPAIPPIVLRYAYAHADSRPGEIDNYMAEIEQLVTKDGLKRSAGVRFWCSYMYEKMGSQWSQFR